MYSASHKITEANIKELKNLELLINQNFFNVDFDSSFGTSSFDKVNGVILRYHQYQQKKLDYYRLQVQHLHTNKFSDFIPGFVQLVRECILSHQWTNALKVVHALVNEGNKVSNTLWKAGLASLIIGKKPRLIDQYVRQLYKMSKLSCVEILLDYLLYLLAEGNLSRAEDLLQDLKMYHLYVTNESQNVNREYERILFLAYQGMTNYLHWKAGIVETHMENDEKDFINTKLSEDSMVKSSKVTAEKAHDNLSCIVRIPGVWDIFIVKMVEMHEFYDDLETAKSLLKDYRTENLCNPNAHLYLYNFEKDHEGNTDDKIQSLTSVIKLDPSNPLALNLYKELESSDPRAISILFDYLDFGHCKDEIDAWELLEKRLSYIAQKTHGSETETMIVNNCWMSRKDWWPRSTLQSNNSLCRLAECKLKVHNYLQCFSKLVLSI